MYKRGGMMHGGPHMFGDEFLTSRGAMELPEADMYKRGGMMHGGPHMFGDEIFTSNGAIALPDADVYKRGFQMRGCPQGLFNTNALVDSGVIDQATAERINAFCAQKAEAMKAEMEKLRNMSDSELKDYMSAKKSERIKCIEPLEELVSEGIITEAQADAIKAALPKKQRGFYNEARLERLPQRPESGFDGTRTESKPQRSGKSFDSALSQVI